MHGSFSRIQGFFLYATTASFLHATTAAADFFSFFSLSFFVSLENTSQLSHLGRQMLCDEKTRLVTPMNESCVTDERVMFE